MIRRVLAVLAAGALSAGVSVALAQSADDPLRAQLERDAQTIKRGGAASQFDPEFIRQLTDAKALATAIEMAKDSPGLDPKVSQKDIEFAQKAAAQAAVVAKRALDEEAAKNGVEISDQEKQRQNPWADQGITLIAVSTSMPKAQLRDLLTSIAGKPRTAAVIRGLFPGHKTINETIEAIAAISKDLPKHGELYIDPTVFADYDVRVVPTVIRTGDKPGTAAGRMEGNYNLSYFDEKLETRRKDKLSSDIGRVGPVFEIAERDITEEMKERLSKIDMKERFDKALDRFWKEDRFQTLPRASRDSTRTFEPIFTVKKDIESSKPGQFIARAGQTVNPLATTPMTRRIFVFDGTDPRQVARIKKEAAARVDMKQPVYMLTGLPTGPEGWKAYERLQNDIGAHLYVLPVELRRNFRLQAVPSIVTADGLQVTVQELGIPS